MTSDLFYIVTEVPEPKGFEDLESPMQSATPCIPVYVGLCTVSACLPAVGTVRGSYLLSLAVHVCLVTSCMMFASYLILIAYTAPTSGRICFIL